MRNGWIGLLGLALGLLGCGEPESKGPREALRVPVEVLALRPTALIVEREAVGTLKAREEARMLAQIEGPIRQVLVEEGDRVRRGQVLLRLDAPTQTAQLSAARAAVREAEEAYARAERLVALGAAAPVTVEAATRRRADARAQLAVAEVAVGYGTVTSPIAGVVTFRGADAGDIAALRQPLLTVADLSELAVEVPVSEADLSRLKTGDTVAVTVDAVPGRQIRGRIRRLFPAIDPATRQGTVEVAVAADAALRPGQLARVVFRTDEVPGALTVPTDAIRRNARDEPYLFVASPDSALALRRSVQLGLTGRANQVQILGGVASGELVVVTGQGSLSDSTAIRVLQPAPELPAR